MGNSDDPESLMYKLTSTYDKLLQNQERSKNPLLESTYFSEYIESLRQEKF